MMKTNSTKPARAARTALLLLTTSLCAIGAAPGAHAQDVNTVDDIIITATKRAENLQDVPVSVQAIGEERLEELNISNFKEYAQHLPTLSYAPTYGPGYDRPFMRGVASGENGNHSGSMPSVGTYLDEQPITTITGNLDLHLFDVARVEVLAGPQGTLYGASSQSGTVRIVTNRPSTEAFDAGYELEVNTVKDGEFGEGAQGFVNIPISDRVAVRLVAWAEHEGGYIDNRFGTRDYPITALNTTIHTDNADRAEDDYNTVDTYGARISLGIDLNDSWTVTPQLMGQKQSTDGVFAQQSDVGDFGVTHFLPEWSEDTWIQGALTVNGTISNFDVVFAYSRLSRDLDSDQDYADYGYFYDALLGYGCYFTDNTTPGACAGVGLPGDPLLPEQLVEGRDHFDRDTYELRIASPAENRLRMIAGLFYQKATHEIHQRYVIEGFRDEFEVANWDDTIWLTEQTREDEETAVFGELSFDFTDKLTGTVGVRSYKTDNALVGFFGYGVNYSSGTGESQCFAPYQPIRGAVCTNLDKSTDESGELYRANIQYRIDDDRMVYATYSEGFRPGGINRKGTLPPYAADFLENYEAGWKTDWANGSLRWNGAIFHEVWKDFQFAFLGQNGLTQIQNAGDADINGVETDLTWIPVNGLMLTAGVTYIDSELTSAAIPDTLVGTKLPVSPDVKADVVARYEFPFGDWDAFVQGGVSYVGERSTDIRQTEAALLGDIPSYWLTDVSAGIERGGYTLTLFVNNLFNENAVNGRYTECLITTCLADPPGDALEGVYYDVVAKPLNGGVRLARKF